LYLEPYPTADHLGEALYKHFFFFVWVLHLSKILILVWARKMHRGKMYHVNAFEGLSLFDVKEKTSEQIDAFTRVLAANFNRRDNLFAPFDRRHDTLDSISSIWIKSDDLTVYVHCTSNGTTLRPSLRAVTDFERQSTADSFAYFLYLHNKKLRKVPYEFLLDEDVFVVQDRHDMEDDDIEHDE
jgi:hypothetical protein